MSKATAASEIPTDRRKEIFVALVHEQDQATSPVPESRRTNGRIGDRLRGAKALNQRGFRRRREVLVPELRCSDRENTI